MAKIHNLLDKLVEQAFMERGLYSMAHRFHPQRFLEIGKLVLELPAEERELLKNVTSADFFRDRMDHVLIYTHHQLTLEEQVEQMKKDQRRKI